MEQVRIFISSPGDVAEERDRARRVVDGLRKRYAGCLRLQTVLWEELPLTADISFQEGIDLILSKGHGIDIAVFILWSRLGTPLGTRICRPDGAEYRSGTEREFDLMLAAYERSGRRRPQLLAYLRDDKNGFIEAQRGKSTAELEDMVRQLGLVEAFIREQFHDPETGANLRAFHTFPEPSSFSVRLRQHLRGLLDDRAAETGPPSTQWEGEPYRGLLAFDVEHAPIFFGREKEAADIVEALHAQARRGCAFVLIVGPSGSGKSSLARAGVLPELLETGDGEGLEWRRAVLMPSECTAGLLHGIAKALAEDMALAELREGDWSPVELADLLAKAPEHAVNQIRRALSRGSSGGKESRLFLLVDQLEELFAHSIFSREDIASFFTALKALAGSGCVWVLATVRSDFYARCQEIPDLVEMKSGHGQVDLLPPDPAAFARIVAAPARLAGLRFERREDTGETLDQRILADIGPHPEALPLVEFALAQLWDRRTPNGILTFAQYEQLGGIEGALGRHAEGVFGALPERGRQAFPAALHVLVAVDDVNEAAAVRRRVPLADLTDTPEKSQLTKAFVDGRLLVSHEGRVWIVHEALLRCWDRAARWIADNREFLRIRGRVARAAAVWQADGEIADLLLPKGKPLAEAEALLAARSELVGESLTAYIRASADHHTKSERRSRLRLQLAVAVFLVLAIAATLAGVLAWSQKGKAEKASREAIRIASRSDFDVASVRFEQRESEPDMAGIAVAHLVRALELDPENDAALLRLYSALTLRSWPVPVCGPLRHSDWLASAHFSPDGRCVVTASADGTAQVWESATGKRAGERLLHGEWVNTAQFSPDGRWVVTASQDHTAQVWEAATGKPVGEPLRHEDSVNTAEFSPDGRLLVTGSEDFTAQVWELATREPAGRPLRHESGVHTAQFSPDGRWLVTVSADGTAQVWETKTGTRVGEPLRQEDSVLTAQFSPDGRWIFTSSQDRTGQVWEAATGTRVGEPLRHGQWVHTGRFSPDGRRVVTASADGTAQVWEAATGTRVGQPLQHEDSVDTAQFSPDGRRVVTASADGTAQVWEAATGRRIGEPLRHGQWVHTAQFSPDGRRVVTTSGNAAQVWEAPPLSAISEPLRHGRWVNTAQFSPDGRWIVTASGDTVQVWEAATGRRVGPPLQQPDWVPTAEFSPDARWIVTGCADKTARVWEAATGRPVGPPLEHQAPVVTAHFSSDARWIVTASRDWTAQVWEAATGRPVGDPLDHGDLIVDTAFNPDGRWVVTASYDGTAQVWEASSGKRIGEPLRHAGSVESAEFSPDGRWIVTASADGTGQVWEAATGRRVGDALHHNNGIVDAAFSPDGRWVVTASLDGTAQVWESSSGTRIGEPLRHAGPLESAKFSPDGRWIVTTFGDTAQVWESSSGRRVGEPLGHAERISSAQFSPDGRWILTASGDKTARIWHFSPPDDFRFTPEVLEVASMLAGIRLTPMRALERVRPEEICTLRQQIAKGRSDEPGMTLAKWLLSDPSLRTMHPFSSLTVAEWVENRVKEDRPEGLFEAVRYAPNNAILLSRLAEWQVKPELSEQPGGGWLYADRNSRRATELAPGNAEVWLTRAAVLFEGKRFQDSLQAVQHVIGLDADRHRAWCTKARTLAALGRPGEAVQAGLKAIDALGSDSADTPDKRALLASYCGDLCWYFILCRQYSQASSFGERGVTLAPDETWIRVKLGHTYLLLGRFDKAKEIYLKYKDVQLPSFAGKTVQDMVLEDFDALEKAGIGSPDFDKMRDLFPVILGF